MKIYEGKRTGSTVTVTVDDRPLNPRLDLWDHSPTGFDWGYDGSGPAQLALALIADHLGDDLAKILCRAFTCAVVAKLPAGAWTLTSEQIQAAIKPAELSKKLSEH